APHVRHTSSVVSMTITKVGTAPQKVFCLWPHSLQAYSTRPWSTSLVTRLGAPHLLHFTSSRVWPRVMVTFRAIASLTKRSDSWRIASFDIAGARGFRIINSPRPCRLPWRAPRFHNKRKQETSRKPNRHLSDEPIKLGRFARREYGQAVFVD